MIYLTYCVLFYATDGNYRETLRDSELSCVS